MANAFSILHNYDRPKWSPNHNLINTALSYKQNKIDTNRAKLQNLYDQFSVLQVAKDVDQSYIESRLEAVRNITNKYANMDLSDDNFTASLMNNVAQVLDDKVKTAILSTKRIQAEDAAWKKLQAEHPDKYSQLNHQYSIAMSDRQRYLSSVDTGDTYRGGANVVEYRDLSKKLMENIPKLQDALHAKWIQTGPQQGYFQSIDTYESVDPAKMRMALSTLFDQKDIQQININAWGVYGNADDAAIAEDFKAHFDPKIEAQRERVEAIEIAMNKATGAERTQLAEMYQTAKENLTSMEGQTYEEFVQNYGKQSAYTTLYRDKYFDNILGAYAYEPRLIDRKVDEVQKANLEYQLKLDEFEERKWKNRMDLALKQQELDQKKKEADLGKEPYEGAAEPVEPAEGMSNFIYQHYEDRAKAYDDVLSSLTQATGLSEDKVKASLRDKNFIAALNNLSATGSITIGGKKVEMTPDLLVQLTKFKSKYLERSEVDKQMYGVIEAMMGDIATRIQRAGNDFDPSTMPNFNFRLEKGADGKFHYKGIDKEKNPNAHNYAHLLRTGGKTESDAMTKNLYMALHMYRDPNVSNDKKKVLKDYIRTNIYPNLDPTARKAVDKAFAGLRNVSFNGGPTGLRDYWLTDITRGDVEQGGVIGAAKSGLSAVTALKEAAVGTAMAMGVVQAPGAMEALQDPTYRSQVAALQQFKDLDKGINRVIDDAFKGLDQQLNKVYASNRALPENIPYYFHNKTDQYQSLKRLLGVTDAAFKDDIKVKVVMDPETGMPTNQVELSANLPVQKSKDNPAGKVSTTQVIPIEKLSALGIDLDTKRYNSFDARVPEYANKISLGNLSFDIDKQAKLGILDSGLLAKNLRLNDPQILNYLVDIGQQDGVEVSKLAQQIIVAYEQNEFSFDLEPINGKYHVVVSTGGEIVHRHETNYSNFDDETLKQVLNDPRDFAEPAILGYIERARLEARKSKMQQ